MMINLKRKIGDIMVCLFIVTITTIAGCLDKIGNTDIDDTIHLITLAENRVPIETEINHTFGNGSDPRIHAQDKLVHIIWDNWTDLFYARSDDNGTTWENVRILIQVDDSKDEYVGDCEITSYANNVHIICSMRLGTRHGLYYIGSTNNGTDWDSRRFVTDENGSPSQEREIVAYEDCVYVAFTDYRGNSGPEVFFTKSKDNGISWSKDVLLSKDNSYHSKSPSIVVNGEEIVVVWWEPYRNNYITSSDGGQTWSSIKSFYSLGSQEYQIIKNHDNMVHMVYYGFYDEYSLFYRRSLNNGTSWENTIYKFTEFSFGDKRYDIAVFKENISISWKLGDFIFFKISSDSGANWENDTFRLRIPMCESRRPDISISEGILHIGTKSGEIVYYTNVNLSKL